MSQHSNIGDLASTAWFKFRAAASRKTNANKRIKREIINEIDERIAFYKNQREKINLALDEIMQALVRTPEAERRKIAEKVDWIRKFMRRSYETMGQRGPI
jgi:hypothetical protein